MRPGPATTSPRCCPRAGPGPRAPDTLTARGNLARFTGEAGDAARARDQFAALLPIRERVLGAEHPDTLATRSNLAHWTSEAEPVNVRGEESKPGSGAGRSTSEWVRCLDQEDGALNWQDGCGIYQRCL